MPDLRLRVRGPNGQTVLVLDDSITIEQFQRRLTDATSLPYYTVQMGTPPLPLQPIDFGKWSSQSSLVDTGLMLHNSLLTLSPAEGPVSSAGQAERGDALTATRLQSPVPQSQLSLERKSTALHDPPEIDVPEWGMSMVLRVMPDDNSCLFRALGTCVLSDEIDAATELRDIVASVIQADTTIYNEAFLGMAPDKYCKKIKDPDAWGGEIEISIIAGYFGVSIDAINVQDLHVYSYNQDASQKCFIIYSGIHYDAIAMTGGGVDIKQFDSSDTILLDKAIAVCRILQSRHYFTDTASFGIRCLQPGCGWTGNGEKAANEHAGETGHTQFGES